MKTIYRCVDTNEKLYQAKTIKCIIFDFHVKRLYPPLMELRVFNYQKCFVCRDIWITKFAQLCTFLSNKTIRRLHNDSGTCKIHKNSEFLWFRYFGILNRINRRLQARSSRPNLVWKIHFLKCFGKLQPFSVSPTLNHLQAHQF